MPIYHRKLLPEPDSNQTTVSSDCGHNSTNNNCSYVSIYLLPEPPQVPPSSTTNNDTTTHVSPCLIVIVALIASAVLLISYYLISIRYCARLRTPTATTQVNEETRDFMNQDQQPEINHPIWYINTIGLLPAVINSITVFKFKKGVSLVDGMDCSVCLSEFKDDESLRLLPKCNHAFHIPCIDTWLRSHTNCPLCRAAIVFNNSNTILQPNYQNRNQGFGLNLNTHMENEENYGELLLDDVQECESHEHGSEIHESKQEVEAVIALRRSLSMDSAADIVLTNSNLSNSTIELQSLNHEGDSRKRRTMMMVRSLSYGGRSIM